MLGVPVHANGRWETVAHLHRSDVQGGDLQIVRLADPRVLTIFERSRKVCAKRPMESAEWRGRAIDSRDPSEVFALTEVHGHGPRAPHVFHSQESPPPFLRLPLPPLKAYQVPNNSGAGVFHAVNSNNELVNVMTDERCFGSSPGSGRRFLQREWGGSHSRRGRGSPTSTVGVRALRFRVAVS